MKNKKVLISIAVVVSILLVSAVIGVVLFTNKENIFKFAYKENNVETVENVEQQNEIAEVVENVENTENVQNIAQNESETKTTNIQEARLEAVSKNGSTSQVSSRSEVDRTKTYTKIEDVKISFNMDVSKTTGLSKEDFITLVTNMKYDKTGILKKNAAWIWECCQKYQVNEIFVLGICGIESGWCSAPQHQRTHNYSSLMKGGKLIQYSTDEQGFEAMIKLLGQKYLKQGGGLYHGSTITGVGTSYCNTTTWPPKVYKCMTQVLQ